MIIFDLDGTLSIVGDRVKYLHGENPDWDSFYEACEQDLVNEPVRKIFNAVREREIIKIVTGRRESTRHKTLNWLINNDMPIFSEDIYMRPDGDTRHDTIIKPELVRDFIHEIDMVFEDRNSMVKMWREIGIVCFQVAEGDF